MNNDLKCYELGLYTCMGCANNTSCDVEDFHKNITLMSDDELKQSYLEHILSPYSQSKYFLKALELCPEQNAKLSKIKLLK